MSDIKRRDFLKVLGATGAGAALTGCAPQSTEKLIPYLIPPDNSVPGVASWYATVCRECPAGCGMLVRTREGRAVKVEGNPDHPVNQGALCVRGQASLQGLYDPDRIRQPLRKNADGEFDPITWDEGLSLLTEKLKQLPPPGVLNRAAFVTPLLTGSLDKLVGEWCQANGIGTRLRYEPFAYEALRQANRVCFGSDFGAVPDYKIEEADFLLSFGADFLETWLSPVNYARQFQKFREPKNGGMGRFVYAGPRQSLTAANADEWLAIIPGSEMELALGLVHLIIREKSWTSSISAAEATRFQRAVSAYDANTVASKTGLTVSGLEALARGFAAASASLALPPGVAVTGSNATATAVAVNLLNYVAGKTGLTMNLEVGGNYSGAATAADLLKLSQQIGSGQIDLLLLHDVNPAFSLPATGNGFAQLADRVEFVVSFSSILDETSSQANLVLPSSTPLESWGDFEPRAGVRGLQQPAMRPIFDTREFGDVLLASLRGSDGDGESFQSYLRDDWRKVQEQHAPEKDFATVWEESLRQGGWFEPVSAKPVRWRANLNRVDFSEVEREGPNEDAFDLIAYPSLHYYDGRAASRPWLQEIPDPMTKGVWDNWLEMNPKTAEALDLEKGDIVTVSSNYGTLELPVLPYPGLHVRAVAVQLGQGHSRFGRYADGRGANPLQLLPSTTEGASGGLKWYSQRIVIQRTGKRRRVATAGGSDTQMGRGIAQFVPLAALTEGNGNGNGHGVVPLAAEGHEEPKRDMYAPHEHPDYRWGMAIDLNACTGCNACVAACYAENNIPFAGPEELDRGRDLAWLRIERYYAEAEGEPKVEFLPMMCQQCDNAPCEPVCPVYATYHNDEGLNVQVYNRCVGTRYCSNNCPYKVRSFNWFDYEWPEPLHMQLNPDVTVRSKGVMEKCTFCVQRIAGAKDHAQDEGRKVLDGEATPACAQTCASEAIVFGNLDDPEGRVAKMARNPRRYQVLGELNTKPAVTYLKKVVQGPLES